MNLRNQTVLITGGTNGIGLALAKEFAKNKFNLVLVARNEQELQNSKNILEQDYNIKVVTISKDLSTETSALELFNDLQHKNIEVNILVNNVGFANYGKFQNVDVEKDILVMHLNMVSLTILTKLFLKIFLSKNSGKILNVASTSAFQPGPYMAVYYATKAYTLSLGEALYQELQGTNVSISTLCPGSTKTGFQEQSELKNTRLIKLGGLMNADYVAKVGFNGLMKGKSIIIPGFKNKLFFQLLRISPRKLTLKIMNWLQEPF